MLAPGRAGRKVAIVVQLRRLPASGLPLLGLSTRIISHQFQLDIQRESPHCLEAGNDSNRTHHSAVAMLHDVAVERKCSLYSRVTEIHT